MPQFIKAVHAFKRSVVKDRYGVEISNKPQVKTFSWMVWQNLPTINHNKKTYPKAGWIELGDRKIIDAAKEQTFKVPPEFNEATKPDIDPQIIVEVESAFAAGTQSELKTASQLIPYIKAKGWEISLNLSKSKLLDEIASHL